MKPIILKAHGSEYACHIQGKRIKGQIISQGMARFRERQGIEQQAVADALVIAKSTLCRYERGTRLAPRGSWLRYKMAIAKITNEND